MKKRITYYALKPAEWISPNPVGYRLMCCDCGLVHRVDFKAIDGVVFVRFHHDRRATANARRRQQKCQVVTTRRSR